MYLPAGWLAVCMHGGREGRKGWRGMSCNTGAIHTKLIQTLHSLFWQSQSYLLIRNWKLELTLVDFYIPSFLLVAKIFKSYIWQVSPF